MGGWTRVATSDGRLVSVEVTRERLGILVDGELAASVPYPPAGYGGHELLLSAGERYLVMWLYSGQSEVGYELFHFRPSVIHLASLPYERAEGDGPVFAPDESKLALARATNWNLMVYLDADGLEVPLDEDARTTREAVLVWAVLSVQELPDGALTSCRLLVRAPAGSIAEADDCYPPSELAFRTPGALELRTGWGARVHVPLPLPESIMLRGPAKRWRP